MMPTRTQQQQQEPPRQRRRSSHESIRSLFSDAAGVSAGRRPTFSDSSTESSTCKEEAEGPGANVVRPATNDGTTPAPPSCPSSASQGPPTTSVCSAATHGRVSPPSPSSPTPPILVAEGLDLPNSNNVLPQRTNNLIEGLGQEFVMPLAPPASTTTSTGNDPSLRGGASSSSSSSRRRRLHDVPSFQDRRQEHTRNEFYLACVDESFFVDDVDSDDQCEGGNEYDMIGGRREEKEDFERRRQRTQRNEHHMAIADDFLWLVEDESDSDSDEDSLA